MPTQQVADPEELNLLLAASAGDASAFRQLVERHQAAVFRHARFLTDTAEEAEDVLQETFLALLAHVRQLRGEASLRTWLFTVARNAAWQLRRKRGLFVPVEEPAMETLAIAAGWGANPEEMAQRAEERHLLQQAMQRLPNEDREVLLLRDMEGNPGQETAAQLGLTLPALKSRLHRARLRLAAELGQCAHRGGHA